MSVEVIRSGIDYKYIEEYFKDNCDTILNNNIFVINNVKVTLIEIGKKGFITQTDIIFDGKADLVKIEMWKYRMNFMSAGA